MKADASLFAAVYQEHHQALFRYIRSMVRDPDEAQDVLQSVMLKALVALRAEQRDFELRPWLFRIAHNEAINRVRQRRPTVELDATHASLAASACEVSSDRERLQQLWADLARLPERQRQALVLRELSGLSHEEIADVLGTSARLVKQTIFEARVALGEFAEGRAMDCAEIRRVLSDGDGRVRRRRRMRAHLASCTGCRSFDLALTERPDDLRALAPALPAASAAALLGHVLHGTAAVKAGTAAAAGGAGATTAAGGGATAATVGGGALGTAVTTKVAIVATAVVAAAGAAGIATHQGHHAHHGQAVQATPAASSRSTTHSVPKRAHPATAAAVVTAQKASGHRATAGVVSSHPAARHSSDAGTAASSRHSSGAAAGKPSHAADHPTAHSATPSTGSVNAAIHAPKSSSALIHSHRPVIAGHKPTPAKAHPITTHPAKIHVATSQGHAKSHVSGAGAPPTHVPSSASGKPSTATGTPKTKPATSPGDSASAVASDPPTGSAAGNAPGLVGKDASAGDPPGAIAGNGNGTPPPGR